MFLRRCAFSVIQKLARLVVFRTAEYVTFITPQFQGVT